MLIQPRRNSSPKKTGSARLSYSAGVETITRAITIAPRTSVDPTWCSDSTYLPPSGTAMPGFLRKEDFGYFQVVVTAGIEKLNATQGGTSNRLSTTPTGMGGSGTAAQSSAVAPQKTIGPVLAGVGAVAAILL